MLVGDDPARSDRAVGEPGPRPARLDRGRQQPNRPDPLERDAYRLALGRARDDRRGRILERHVDPDRRDEAAEAITIDQLDHIAVPCLGNLAIGSKPEGGEVLERDRHLAGPAVSPEQSTPRDPGLAGKALPVGRHQQSRHRHGLVVRMALDHGANIGQGVVASIGNRSSGDRAKRDQTVIERHEPAAT